MRVISVDPGYDRLGVAVMEIKNDKEVLLFSTCIETDKQQTLPDRIKKAGSEFREIIKKYSPDTLGIETIFFNKNQKTAIGVAQAKGVVIFLAKDAGCEVYEFGPQEIKIAVTGYGKSDKAAVIDMVKRLVPSSPEGVLDDEYDAIAVGITCLAHFGRTQ